MLNPLSEKRLVILSSKIVLTLTCEIHLEIITGDPSINTISPSHVYFIKPERRNLKYIKV